MLKRALTFSLSLMLVIGWASLAVSDDTEDTDSVRYSYGNIAEILQDRIIVKEYVLETDQEEEIAYLINDDSYLENIESLHELIVGDEIEVTYSETDNQRTVLSLAKVMYEEDEADYEELDLEELYLDEEGDESSYETRG